MTQAEKQFKKFDSRFIWEYRSNESGAEVIFTDKRTFETKVLTSKTLESAFEIIFDTYLD